jgi:uncharacterized protein YlxP (DUF503 family)
VFVLVARIDLRLFAAQSLKDKRQVLKSVIRRLPPRYAVAAAEVDYLDDHRRAAIGIAAVGNEWRHLRQVMDRAVAFVAAETDGEIVALQVEER